MNIKGIGVDIIEIERIENAIEQWGDRFLDHCFTKEEIDYCKQYKISAQHFAARFAAKEAVFKAISDQPHLGWKDIVIRTEENGKPYCVVDKKFSEDTIHLSISHTKKYAVANAIISS